MPIMQSTLSGGGESHSSYGIYQQSGRGQFEEKIKGLKDTAIYTLEDYDATGGLYADPIQELGTYFKNGKLLRNISSHFTHSYKLIDQQGNTVCTLGFIHGGTPDKVQRLLQH